MSGFCGWLGWHDEPDRERAVLDAMARTLAPWATQDWASVLGHGAGVAARSTTGVPLVGPVGDHLVAVAGRVGYRATDLRETAGARGDLAALVEGFVRHGADLPTRLCGGFAFVVLERGGRAGLLAVDRIGGRFPLYYRVQGESLLFSSQATAIQAHPRGAADLDPQALYNYLFFHVTPGPRSIRRDVRCLPPAGVAVWRDGRLEVSTYWVPTYREDDRVSLDGLAEEFRSVLREGVRRAADGADRLGCFLSGGTDSSTIAGLVGQVSGQPARTYSIGFAVEGYDESRYARAAVRHFDTVHHEHRMEPAEVVDLIPRVAAAYSEPFGNASAVAALCCARVARELGTTRLLAGDGGDELFAGNQRYATQALFEVYGRVPSWLRRGVLEPLAFGFPGARRVLPIRKLRSYIEQARVPLPRRLESYNQLERASPDTVVHPDLLAAIDPREPLRLHEDVYLAARAATTLNRMLALDLEFTLADNDLPKVSRTCDIAGVDVEYPFLDDDVVDLSCRVPVRWKLRGSQLRWFMKYALRDFLPQEVLRKKKHGFGLPFGLWIRAYAPLRDLARESLDGLARRAIVRPAYVEEVWRRHETEHAAYYGVMIWVLVMLEQWLRVHADRAIPPA